MEQRLYLRRLLESSSSSDIPLTVNQDLHHAIPTLHLFFALFCPLSTAFLAYLFKLELEKKIIIAVLRTVVQLFLAGYVLLGFIFSIQSPLLVVGYLLLMSLIAALEAISRQVRVYQGHYRDSLISVLAGGGLFGILCSILVFDPIPWWNPQVIVPTCGLLIGNSISGPSIAVDRFLAMATEQKHEIETRLAFGATSYEAVIPIIRSCIASGLMPTLNTMAVVGIVSIPGMMAGQLIGGASPMIAAEYQMAILWIICTTSTTSIFVALSLAIRHAVVDNNHCMTTEKISKKLDGKIEIDSAILKLVSLIVHSICGKFSYYYKLTFGIDSNIYERVDEDNRDSVHDIEKSTTLSLELHDKSMRAVADDSILVSSHHSLVDYHFIDNQRSDSILQENILEIKNLNISGGQTDCLFHKEGLSFVLKAGECLAVEGTSGIGKTRLLRAICQLDPIISGSVSHHSFHSSKDTAVLDSSRAYTVERNVLSSSSSSSSSSSLFSSFPSAIKSTIEHVINLFTPVMSFSSDISIPKYRCRCIYVPQALPPMIGTPIQFIKELLSYQTRIDAFPNSTNILNNIEEVCKSQCYSLSLPEDTIYKEWATLSGGERQRVIIMCALIATLAASPSLSSFQEDIPSNNKNNGKVPVVLLLDEPTAACDAASCDSVEKAIIASGASVIIITHDPNQAARLCHRRLILSKKSSLHGTPRPVNY